MTFKMTIPMGAADWDHAAYSEAMVMMAAYQVEQTILTNLGMPIDIEVHDMDRRRVRETADLARDIARVRCAALEQSMLHSFPAWAART